MSRIIKAHRNKGYRPLVHITERRPDGFVEFDFSYGDADLYVELILPAEAFKQFCEANEVTFMSEREAAAVDRDRKKWREASL